MANETPTGDQVVDRVRKAFNDIIMAIVGDVLRSQGFIPGVIDAQSGQKVDFTPDDTNTPSVQGVPIVAMIPQTAITAAPGSRAYMFFANGDRSQPRVTLFDVSTLVMLIIGPSNSPAAARTGDAIVAHLTSAICAQIIAPAGTAGGPCSFIATPSPPYTDTPLQGAITGGSTKIFLG